MINIGAFLSSSIYLISNALLYPTMFLLLVSFIYVIISTGAFIAEWAERARLGGKPSYLVRKPLDAFKDALGKSIRSWDEVDIHFKDINRSFGIKLDRLRLLVRAGPSLGLMGTLIPMSTGLAALSQGDMTRLSSDLVIAFTTTVIGLAIAIVAYTFLLFRRRWFEQDIDHLRFEIKKSALEILGEPE